MSKKIRVFVPRQELDLPLMFLQKVTCELHCGAGSPGDRSRTGQGAAAPQLLQTSEFDFDDGFFLNTIYITCFYRARTMQCCSGWRRFALLFLWLPAVYSCDFSWRKSSPDSGNRTSSCGDPNEAFWFVLTTIAEQQWFMVLCVLRYTWSNTRSHEAIFPGD